MLATATGFQVVIAECSRFYNSIIGQEVPIIPADGLILSLDELGELGLKINPQRVFTTEYGECRLSFNIGPQGRGLVLVRGTSDVFIDSEGRILYVHLNPQRGLKWYEKPPFDNEIYLVLPLGY